MINTVNSGLQGLDLTVVREKTYHEDKSVGYFYPEAFEFKVGQQSLFVITNTGGSELLKGKNPEAFRLTLKGIDRNTGDSKMLTYKANMVNSNIDEVPSDGSVYKLVSYAYFPLKEN